MRRLFLAAALLAGCGSDKSTEDTHTEPAPEPGDLQAGFARAAIPAPVGIGTVGYGSFGAPSSPTPFSTLYPGTTAAFMPPEVRVTAISRGDGFEVVFIRLDTVGVFQQFRRAVVLEVSERLGRDMDDALVFGATHTHAGPGRIIDGGGIFDIIADSYFPEFYVLFIDTIADAVEAALADLQPARLATSAGYSAEAHSDRRCEDGGADYENGTTPFIAIERNGRLEGVVAAYAVHGTGLSIDDLTLSRDVFGAMEQSLEDRFDHPVNVMVLNAWAADMAPSSGEVPYQDGGEVPNPHRSIAETGWQFAEDVAPSLTGTLAWEDEPTVQAKVYRARIDREVIGYAEEEFPFEYGGVYCEGEGECTVTAPLEGLDQVCLPFNEDYPAPNQTVLSAGQVGGLHLITFPGEPGTRLAEGIVADIQAAHPEVEDVLFVGYGQDYLGYSIEEDDWWQGGYEAAGALWGPRQGDYLASVAVAVMDAFMGGDVAWAEADPITPFDDPTYTPYESEQAVDAGQVVVQPAETVVATDTIEVAVTGLAAWEGIPEATLVGADGSVLLRPNGEPWTSVHQPFYWTLEADPPYTDSVDPTPRTFTWTLRFPVQHVVPDVFSLPEGEWTVDVVLPDGTQVTSDTFTVVTD